MDDHVQFEVVHEGREVRHGFEPFVASFEAILGRFDPEVQADFDKEPAVATARLERMAGEQGLMLFATQDHGALLGLLGRARNAKRYYVGNPLIALQMTQHDIRAGLYAPLSVLVYEKDPSTVRVEFDRPSSLFGQFGNAAVTKVAVELDKKLENLIAKASSLTKQATG
jgi:uncharacterized protein (DUF302 family)